MYKKEIKILEVCAIDETAKSLLLPLINRLINEGFRVSICCSYGKNTEELKSKGYDIKSIEIARSINPKSNVKSIFKLRNLMKKERYDIVHVHTPVAALLARIAAKMAGVPIIIYTAHGFYFHERMPRLKYKTFLWIEKLAGRFFTDFIFTQSEEDRLTGLKEKIAKPDKILTISNGVDIWKKFNPVCIDQKVITQKKAELGLAADDRSAIFVGRLVREKGINELVEAFNNIGDSHFKLLLVGNLFTSERDTETCDNISQIAKTNKNIIMTGIRTDINDLLYLSDVFILPSYREGMPRSIIEAMAMRKPVIATNIRGCREEVVEGETGYLVPVRDSNVLRDRIIKVLGNRELAEKMGQMSRVRAESLFDEEKVLDRELNIINQLITEKYGYS